MFESLIFRTSLIKKEQLGQWKLVKDISGSMKWKWGLQKCHYADYKRHFTFNNKLTSLQWYEFVQIMELCNDWFNACPNITSKFCTVAIPKNFAKQNIDSDKILTKVLTSTSFTSTLEV
jgi:hypothetical protein